MVLCEIASHGRRGPEKVHAERQAGARVLTPVVVRCAQDWVDETQIDDPEDTKPEGYDDIPAQARR